MGAGRAVGGVRGSEARVIGSRRRDQLGTVISPEIFRCAASEHKVLDDGDDVLCGAGPVDPDRQRLAGVLIHDVAQLEPALVGGLVEHEVDRPHLTVTGGAQPLLLSRTYPSALAGPHRAPEALLAPDPACALAVDRP